MHTRTTLKHVSHFTFVIAIESYMWSFFILLTANEWSSLILHVYILFKRIQTCSNDHLYNDHSSKTTNGEFTQANFRTIYTIQDDHLSNATSDHFLVTQMRKNLSKTTTVKLYPSKKWKTNITQQYIKNKCLSDYIYSVASL